MVKVQAKLIYGSWKDGSDIYKDSKGYYVIQWNNSKMTDYKKYLPKWKPMANAPKMRFDSKTKKWKSVRKLTVKKRKMYP
jgi:hypothetical protein